MALFKYKYCIGIFKVIIETFYIGIIATCYWKKKTCGMWDSIN